MFGFDPELDKPIHVSFLSMWCLHGFVDGLLNVKCSQYFSPKLNICKPI